jgi:GNAT superfamily N-acetyltransferase
MLLIRAATIGDVPLLRTLIHELAQYERETQSVLITEDELKRDGFGGDAKFRAILAEWEGHPAGYAVFFPCYSTWTGPGMFLEDLFVRETWRGRGIGRALLREVAATAEKEGCRSLKWDVLDWNEPAIEFYKSLGAEYFPQWRNVVLGAEALGRLAKG